MQHLSTPAQIVVPMARLLLGFGVLAFPLILPFVVSSFFTDNDEEGLSNEKKRGGVGIAVAEPPHPPHHRAIAVYILRNPPFNAFKQHLAP